MSIVSRVSDSLIKVVSGIVKLRGKTGKIITSETDGSKERMHTTTKIDNEVTIGNGGNPYIDSKTRWYELDYNNNIGSWKTVFSDTGIGRCYIYYLNFETNESKIRITIDDTVVTEGQTYSNAISVENFTKFGNQGMEMDDDHQMPRALYTPRDHTMVSEITYVWSSNFKIEVKSLSGMDFQGGYIIWRDDDAA